MDFSIIIQARMGSTRLPSKTMLKIKNKPLLDYVYNQVFQSKKISKIIIATTTLSEDNLISDYATSKNISVYRGDSQNVLDRFFQCAKILRFMGLSYKQLYSDDDASVGMRKMMYKEKSNIFAYYIVKALLLYKYDDFLLWCKKHNKNILQFNNLKAFYTFIGKTYNDPNFLEHLNRTSFLQVSDFLKKTMRMTLLEIS